MRREGEGEGRAAGARRLAEQAAQAAQAKQAAAFKSSSAVTRLIRANEKLVKEKAVLSKEAKDARQQKVVNALLKAELEASQKA